MSAGPAEINAKLPQHATPSRSILDGVGAGNCWRYCGQVTQVSRCVVGGLTVGVVAVTMPVAGSVVEGKKGGANPSVREVNLLSK